MANGEHAGNGAEAQPNKTGLYQKHKEKGKAVLGIGAILGAMWTSHTDLQKMVIQNHTHVLKIIDAKHEIQTKKMDGIREKIEEAFSLYMERMGENGSEIHVLKVRACAIEANLKIVSGECKK